MPKSARAWKKKPAWSTSEVHHFHKPIERPFTADQRSKTTLLFGGLTWKHEKLVHGALEGLGYRCEAVPTPERQGLPARQGVRQQRPVQPDLLHRRQPGAVSAEPGRAGPDASRKSSTATSSSPPAPAARAASACTKPSTAWRCATAGFDGFRVLLFQQSGGLNQSDAEAGLEMNLDFFLGILNALNMRRRASTKSPTQIRPFEVERRRDRRASSTSAWTTCTRCFRKKQPWKLEGELGKLPGRLHADTAEYLGKFVNQLNGDDYIAALRTLPRPLQRDRGRPPAREAHRQDHRRVLGADHRGRRQLQHVPVPASAKARRCWSSPSAPGSCT